MGDKHSELEQKYVVKEFQPTFNKFQEWAFHKNVYRFRHIDKSNDTYYRNELGAVVRHRVGAQEDGTFRNELTVKLRKSNASTINRLEIDLGIKSNTTEQDVQEFLKHTGYKPEFYLAKDSYIYDIKGTFFHAFGHIDFECTAAMYGVTVYQPNGDYLSGPDWYIEIEIEKEAKIEEKEALEALDWLGKNLRTKLSLGEPINQSLYEIYSGKQYGLVSEPPTNGVML